MSEATTTTKRIVIEVSDEARARLKAVAAVRRMTMRELIDELARQAEVETFGARTAAREETSAAA